MKLYSFITTGFTFLIAPFFVGCKGGRNKEKLKLDFRTGDIEGNSNFIKVLTSSTVSSTRTMCDGQAVLKISFSGPYQKARFVLEYDEDPREWTLDISNSPTGDGFGGNGQGTSYIAETQILNRQMRVYSNNLPGHTQETINGGLLMKVVDDIVDSNSRLIIEISNERIKWNNNANIRGSISSRYLYALENQTPLYGLPDYNIYAGFNRVPGGDYRSGSGLCRATVTVANKADQVEVTECNDGTHTCEENAVCTQTRRSFRCSCKNGFSRQGTSCIDVDECEVKNGGCVHTCTNSPGSYTCGCKRGFVLSPEGRDCVDLNECNTGAHDCEHQCVNTIGSYECRCPDGQYLHEEGSRCSRDPGCRNPDLGCAHYCVDISINQSVCACRIGFILSGNKKNCIPTCSHGNGGCQHICTESPRPVGPLCSCHEKYNLHTDLKTCVETCGLNNGGCDQVCRDTPNGVRCSCPEGYELQTDGRTCRDINECIDNNGGCDNQCSNRIGGYECSCPSGYKLLTDGRSCIDVDECAINGTCDHTCINFPGGFSCECNPGYQLYGITHCGDVDECSINNGGCQYGCVNLPGSYQCFCDRGYRLHPNRKDCMETSRCLPLRTPALAVLECDKEDAVETCSLQCESNSHLSTSEEGTYTYRCGQSTQYVWTPEMRNDTLPSCSEAVNAPVLHRRASFTFTADRCRLRKKSQSRISENFRETLSKKITAINARGCSDLCQVSFVNLSCDNRDNERSNGKRKRRERSRRSRGSVITADFEIEIRPETPTASCDVNCVHSNTEKQLQRTIRKLRKSINKERFVVRFLGKEYEVIRKSLTTSDVEASCPLGHILMVDDRCVACSVGTYHDTDVNECIQCPAGTFQDQEGQMECSKCPQGDGNYGIPGARDITECGGQCRPGEYSMDGFQPCDQCPVGTFQPEPGHTYCLPCGGGLQTRQTGSTSFGNCLAREICTRGHFYNVKTHQCEPCKKGTYQPLSSMNYCIRCPGNTTTDSVGSHDSGQCKDRTCRGVIGDYMGYIESPNYPGNYPANVECEWHFSPPKGRRLIFVVSEIFLPKEDECGDFLVMRKSEDPYSVSTFETCENETRPIAFTAQTRKLYVQFQSNAANSHAGFQIHYATYDQEYEYLIKDIVADGRLYESNHHQEILKDKAVLTALLEVIAHPEMYYKYSTEDSESLLPQSFIKLLRSKVSRFFYPDP